MSTLHAPPLSDHNVSHNSVSWGHLSPASRIRRANELMAINSKNAMLRRCPQIGDSMNEEKIPACPEGHGEMVPAMGEVKKGEIRRIEQNWECEACGKIVTLPFP